MQQCFSGQGQHEVRKFFGEAGLSLIEVVVAMAVFMVISTGIAGTITVGLRGTVHSRLAAMAKTVAQQQIEEMRSRPYYVPYSSDATVGTTSDVDLLDVYYPNLNLAHHHDNRGWESWYTQTAGDAYYTTMAPIDEQGMQVTVVTRFVDSDNGTIVPLPSYSAHSADADTPPSNLVSVVVTVSWPQNEDISPFPIATQISATGQSVATTGVGGGGGNDCQHASNSNVDIYGVMVSSFAGDADPFSLVAEGNMGEAHAHTSYGCSTETIASGLAGNITVGGDVWRGADASLNQNTPGELTVGPVTTGGPSGFPKPSMSDTYAKAEVESEDMEAEAEGEARPGTQKLELAGVDDSPDDSDKNYLKWDFLNPVVTATADSEMKAELEQQQGETSAEAHAAYKQVTILPAQHWPTDTTANASALQGLVFVRDFEMEAHAKANGEAGGEGDPSSFSYQATVGMFNPKKAGCTYSSTGDTCYDLYSIGPNNPLQTAVPLLTDPATQDRYALQYALVGDWSSVSAADITDAMTYSPDGTNTKVAIDAVIRLSFDYGTEIKQKTANGNVVLVNPAGYQLVNIGKININLTQNQ